MIGVALDRLWRFLREPGSGPWVARLFHRLLALVMLDAWLSLGSQLCLLIGRRGLLPLVPFLDQARRADVSWSQLPTLFWWGASDATLLAVAWVGGLLALSALVGFLPRLCFLFSTGLYLSCVVACRTFCSFQWDNLLLECGVLALFLPGDRRARWAHVLFRVLLFKLYWESGLAKAGSPLHDWHDGSAMTFYYETAPLPTRLAWYAHALPAGWHHLESWATLGFECVLPFAIFGPRVARLACAVVLTLFQIVNAATANYGFFCYLACALHVFLLDDGDVERARVWLRARAIRWRDRLWRRSAFASRPETAALERTSWKRWREAWSRRPARTWIVAAAFSALYVPLSAVEAYESFGGARAAASPLLDAVAPLREHYLPFRVINTYHLFAAITRERIEPELQTFDGVTWTAHHLRHKPGATDRAPDYVAPHQPRVDFQLWFYGLGYSGGTPAYVATLVERLCHEPAAVAPLFAAPLPAHPDLVRIEYWQYHFTTREERRATGQWWKRESRGQSGAVPCNPSP